MENNLHIEQFLMKSKSSDTGFIPISKILKTNLSSASPETWTLIQRYKHYQSHHKWIQENFHKTQKYNIVDRNDKVYHDKWIMKLNKMFYDKPSMKESLLDKLVKFTLSRYEDSINAPRSSKLIEFFKLCMPSINKFIDFLVKIWLDTMSILYKGLRQKCHLKFP